MYLSAFCMADILHASTCERLCVMSFSLSKSPSATQGAAAPGLSPLAFHFTSLSSTPFALCVACAPAPSSLHLSPHMYFPLCPLLSSLLSLILLCTFFLLSDLSDPLLFTDLPLCTSVHLIVQQIIKKNLNITIFVAVGGWTWYGTDRKCFKYLISHLSLSSKCLSHLPLILFPVHTSLSQQPQKYCNTCKRWLSSTVFTAINVLSAQFMWTAKLEKAY